MNTIAEEPKAQDDNVRILKAKYEAIRSNSAASYEDWLDLISQLASNGSLRKSLRNVPDFLYSVLDNLIRCLPNDCYLTFNYAHTLLHKDNFVIVFNLRQHTTSTINLHTDILPQPWVEFLESAISNSQPVEVSMLNDLGFRKRNSVHLEG